MSRQGPSNAVIGGRVSKAILKTPEKPKQAQKQFGSRSSEPKYGWCPQCQFGHKVRGGVNPENGGKFAGQFRFTCSKPECNFLQLLNEDPMLTAPPTPSKHPECPQCGLGRLLKKCKDVFNYKDQYLECTRRNAPERPCDYRQAIQTPSKEKEAKAKATPKLDGKKETDMKTIPPPARPELILSDPAVTSSSQLQAGAMAWEAAILARDPEGLIDLTKDDPSTTVDARSAIKSGPKLVSSTDLTGHDSDEEVWIPNKRISNATNIGWNIALGNTVDFDDLDADEERQLVEIADAVSAAFQ
ncbi:hypothetical protein B0T26DRAFT_506713 [Lasiosphaeria miniovina]|uniref:Uncharacterized protein n=1 Tax=Lasiosphaeria miniovina TaxID=1954250 RepID=A0AA39ZTW5_9PEZI|nr:uncharacterized protein B0T26DRAFT_506713 [Lasiosphaeria miniovina]KAK0703592.1 hypothetical protein B0T26DRAFT_506713 [Lasiosphaeria miniovina]